MLIATTKKLLKYKFTGFTDVSFLFLHILLSVRCLVKYRFKSSTKCTQTMCTYILFHVSHSNNNHNDDDGSVNFKKLGTKPYQHLVLLSECQCLDSRHLTLGRDGSQPFFLLPAKEKKRNQSTYTAVYRCDHGYPTPSPAYIKVKN